MKTDASSTHTGCITLMINILIRTVFTTAISIGVLAGTPRSLGAQSAGIDQALAANDILNLRIVALGHRRLAEFKRSENNQVVETEGTDGEVFEDREPSGIPIEIRGEPFEYLPSLVYVRERGLPDGRQDLFIPLTLNSASPIREISNRNRVDLLVRQAAEENGDQTTFSAYASVPVAENQSHMLIALINRHTEEEGWRDPIVRSFDISPNQLPGGTLLLFNGTPFEMEIDIKTEDSVGTFAIEPMGTRKYTPHIDEKGRSFMRANLVARNGAKKQIYLNSIKVDSSGRTYLFAYFDPRRRTSNPAGLIQFSDQIPSNKP